MLTPLRIHTTLLSEVATALERIFEGGEPSDKVVPALLKRHKVWGARDRRFVAETIYDTVRNKRKYEHLLSRVGEQAGLPAGTTHRENWGLVSLVSLAVRGFTADSTARLEPVYQTWLPIIADLVPSLSNDSTYLATLPRAVVYSVADWIDERGAKELGAARWEEYLTALNRPASVWLRVNTIRTTPQALAATLLAEGIGTEANTAMPNALRLLAKAHLTENAQYLAGAFEFQDLGSQHIAAACAVEAGMVVIDACAGAGGKTLQLAAALYEARGLPTAGESPAQSTLIASDIHPERLERLVGRASRAGVSKKLLRTCTLSELSAQYESKADRVLIDAPCSGLGVLRRNPDTKYNLTKTALDDLLATQANLLSTHSTLVKRGGWLIYATCSVLMSENEAQIQHFLECNPDTWKKLSEQRTNPTTDDCDGFYIAVLERLK